MQTSLQSATPLGSFAYFFKKSLRAVVSSLFIMAIGLLCICLAFVTPVVYMCLFHYAFSSTQLGSLVFLVSYSFCCFVAIPALWGWFVFHEKLTRLGLCLPKINANVIMLSIALFILCICGVYWLSFQPSFQQYYGMVRQMSWLHFLFLQCVLLPIYYLGEEFFFRGFLFLKLWERIGWHSLWITELLFTIAHFTKPNLEILFAVPVGIILNLLTLWTRSIVPAIIFHAGIGLTLNSLFYFS